MKVPNSEIGIASAEIKVARKFLKNGYITIIERTIASNSASIVAWVALRIYSA